MGQLISISITDLLWKVIIPICCERGMAVCHGKSGSSVDHFVEVVKFSCKNIFYLIFPVRAFVLAFISTEYLN